MVKSDTPSRDGMKIKEANFTKKKDKNLFVDLALKLLSVDLNFKLD